MSSPLPAQPHPDRDFPFDGATVKQPLWKAVMQCTFFVVVCVPGALLWWIFHRTPPHTRPHREVP